MTRSEIASQCRMTRERLRMIKGLRMPIKGRMKIEGNKKAGSLDWPAIYQLKCVEVVVSKAATTTTIAEEVAVVVCIRKS